MQAQAKNPGLGIERRVEEVHGCGPDEVAAAVRGVEQPLLLRGLVADWPVVKHARESVPAALQHIASFYSGRPVSLFLAEADTRGRFFYNQDLTGFNFLQMEANLFLMRFLVLKEMD